MAQKNERLLLVVEATVAILGTGRYARNLYMPVILEWSNQLATEHPLIDEQHQSMIAMINHLHACITEPMQRPEFFSPTGAVV